MSNQIEKMSIKDAQGVRQGRVLADTPEKTYEAPVLVHYGDVRDVTLGPTVGIGESGNELGRRNPP